jgi:hypothetical protein
MSTSCVLSTYAAKTTATMLNSVRGRIRSTRAGSIGAWGRMRSTCSRISERRSGSLAFSSAVSMTCFSACFAALIVLRSAPSGRLPRTSR